LSAEQHPASRLIVMYHERWEEELAIDELKTHQRDQRLTLRSETPTGVVQELSGLLLAHYAVRKLICEAAVQAPISPRQLSFVNTLKILRCRLPECPRSAAGLRRWHADLLLEIAEEKLELRRHRINPRVIKRQVSKWPEKREVHRRPPATSTAVRPLNRYAELNGIGLNPAARFVRVVAKRRIWHPSPVPVD
jgi:hypothetical protein